MRKYLTAIICCCFVISSFAQNYKKLVLADSLAMQNDYRGAIKVLGEILDDQPRTFLKAQAYFQLSHAYLQLFDLEKAHRYNRQSLELRDRIHYEFIADNYMRFGTIALQQGDYHKALDYLLEAQALPHESLQFSGILDGYLGATYERLGKSKQALQYYQNSLEVLSWELPENHPDLSVAHYNLGNYYSNIGEYPQAIEAYDKAVAIEYQTSWGKLGIGNPRLVKAYNALGIAKFKEELDVTESKEMFELAMRYSRGFPRLEAMSKINLAQTYFIERNFEKTDETLEEALAILNYSEEEDPAYSISLLLDKGLYMSGLQLKAEVLLEAYNATKDILNLERAFEYSQLSMEVFEGQLSDFYIEKSKLSMLVKAKDVYERSIFIALKLYEQKGEMKHLDAAFQSAERGKALILKNQLQQLEGLLALSLPEEIRRNEQELRYKTQLLETDLGSKYEGDNFRKIRLDTDLQYQALLKKIERAAPQYFYLRYYIPQFSIEAIQTKLAADEVLLSYYQGQEHYYIFAISKQGVQHYYNLQNAPLAERKKGKLKLGPTAAQTAKSGFPVPNPKKKKEPKFPKPDVGIYTKYTEKELDLKTSVTKGMRGVVKLSQKQFIEASHSLYRRLIEPVQDILKNKKQLIIIPHGDLHFVSFETLLKQKPKKKPKYHKLKYLIKDYSVAYLNTAEFLQSKTASKERNVIRLAAFAPVFNPSDSIGYTLNAGDLIFDTTYVNDSGLRALLPDRSSFKELEYSEKEVQAILKTLAKKGIEGKAFFKDKATETLLKDSLSRFNYLHLASHSFVHPTHPNLSGLALIEDGGEDGILFAGEVVNLDLKNVDLVVLSSCESGTGTLVKGEGLLSLNRAFQMAGAQKVLSTKWKISDKASAQLMALFYDKLLDGASHSEALRYAKLKMIKKSKTATPRLWAGYILNGY